MRHVNMRHFHPLFHRAPFARRVNQMCAIYTKGLRLIVAEELKTIYSLKRDKRLATFADFKTLFTHNLRGISLSKPMADIIENCFCIAHI